VAKTLEVSVLYISDRVATKIKDEHDLDAELAAAAVVLGASRATGL
jgi:hypothetical protein